MRIVARDTRQCLALFVAPTFLQIADLVGHTVVFGQFHFQNSKIIFQRLAGTVAERRLFEMNCICMALRTDIHEPFATELPWLQNKLRHLFQWM